MLANLAWQDLEMPFLLHSNFFEAVSSLPVTMHLFPSTFSTSNHKNFGVEAHKTVQSILPNLLRLLLNQRRNEKHYLLPLCFQSEVLSNITHPFYARIIVKLQQLD